MTQRAMTRNSKTLAAALFVGTALTTAAWAQFGSGPLIPPAAPAGTPVPMGGPTMPGGSPNTPGGSPFISGRMPFANGTVTAVDAAGTITLAPMFGGGAPQTVKVTDTTQITATRAGTVGDLKVGDKIQVRGVPTGITASQIAVSDSADTTTTGVSLPPAGPRFGPRFGGPAPRPDRTAAGLRAGDRQDHGAEPADGFGLRCRSSHPARRRRRQDQPDRIGEDRRPQSRRPDHGKRQGRRRRRPRRFSRLSVSTPTSAKISDDACPALEPCHAPPAARDRSAHQSPAAQGLQDDILERQPRGRPHIIEVVAVRQRLQARAERLKMGFILRQQVRRDAHFAYLRPSPSLPAAGRPSGSGAVLPRPERAAGRLGTAATAAP